MSSMARAGNLILLIVFVFMSCKKDDPNDGWESCLECNINSWIGIYSGTAEFKDLSAGNTKAGLPVTISVTEIAENYLRVQVQVPNYYASTLSGNYVGSYSISMAGSNYSFSGNLQTKDNSLRLIGESKYFVIKENEIITEEIVVFEALKQL